MCADRSTTLDVRVENSHVLALPLRSVAQRLPPPP
jgi:hypothetical protein